MPIAPGFQSMMAVNYTSNAKQNRPESLIWTNGKILFYQKFPAESEEIYENGMKKFTYLNVAKGSDTSEDKKQSNQIQFDAMPEKIALTQYHYLILYQNQLVIYSKITSQVIKFFELSNFDRIVGIFYDSTQKLFYFVCQESIKQLSVFDEPAMAWYTYLKSGKLQEALDLCETDIPPAINPQQVSYVFGQLGNELYQAGRYQEAAKAYLSSSLSFEYIFLKFIQLESVQACEILDHIIQYWLYYYPEENQVQNHILRGWQLESYVKKIKYIDLQLSTLRVKIRDEKRDPQEGESIISSKSFVLSAEEELKIKQQIKLLSQQ